MRVVQRFVREKCMYGRYDGKERGTRRAEVSSAEQKSSANVKPKSHI